MNKAQQTRLMRIVSDNPGINCKDLSLKLEVKRATVKYWLIRLEKNGRIFRQSKGCTKLLFTAHAAEANHVPAVCPIEPEKTVLELQMMFNRLYLGLAL